MACRAMSLWGMGALLATASLAQSGDADHTGATGRIVRKSLDCGHYLQYAPKRDPQSILVIVHGSLGKDEAALDVAERFIKRWTDVAERRRLLLLAPAFDQ
jgi:poly(3-hydroxybutyrate) depolymerase